MKFYRDERMKGIEVVVKSHYWKLFCLGMKPHILPINTVRESGSEE